MFFLKSTTPVKQAIFQYCSALKSVSARQSSSAILRATAKTPATAAGADAQLFVSVCVERAPIITCDMNELEKRYSAYINELNVKKSLLSDHELRHISDLERLAKRKLASAAENEESDVVIESALDFEDKSLRERKSLPLSERRLYNAADNAKDASLAAKDATLLKNIDHILDKKLILLIQNNERPYWHLPQLAWQPNETSLRQTADRCISELSKELQVSMLGNAPIGVNTRKRDKDGLTEKCYFFKAQYKSGADVLASSNLEFIWIRKDEMKYFIKQQSYLDCINKFILDF